MEQKYSSDLKNDIESYLEKLNNIEHFLNHIIWFHSHHDICGSVQNDFNGIYESTPNSKIKSIQELLSVDVTCDENMFGAKIKKICHKINDTNVGIILGASEKGRIGGGHGLLLKVFKFNADNNTIIAYLYDPNNKDVYNKYKGKIDKVVKNISKDFWEKTNFFIKGDKTFKTITFDVIAANSEATPWDKNDILLNKKEFFALIKNTGADSKLTDFLIENLSTEDFFDTDITDFIKKNSFNEELFYNQYCKRLTELTNDGFNKLNIKSNDLIKKHFLLIQGCKNSGSFSVKKIADIISNNSDTLLGKQSPEFTKYFLHNKILFRNPYSKNKLEFTEPAKSKKIIFDLLSLKDKNIHDFIYRNIKELCQVISKGDQIFTSDIASNSNYQLIGYYDKYTDDCNYLFYRVKNNKDHNIEYKVIEINENNFLKIIKNNKDFINFCSNNVIQEYLESPDVSSYVKDQYFSRLVEILTTDNDLKIENLNMKEHLYWAKEICFNKNLFIKTTPEFKKIFNNFLFLQNSYKNIIQEHVNKGTLNKLLYKCPDKEIFKFIFSIICSNPNHNNHVQKLDLMAIFQKLDFNSLSEIYNSFYENAQADIWMRDNLIKLIDIQSPEDIFIDYNSVKPTDVINHLLIDNYARLKENSIISLLNSDKVTKIITEEIDNTPIDQSKKILELMAKFEIKNDKLVLPLLRKVINYDSKNINHSKKILKLMANLGIKDDDLTSPLIKKFVSFGFKKIMEVTKEIASKYGVSDKNESILSTLANAAVKEIMINNKKATKMEKFQLACMTNNMEQINSVRKFNPSLQRKIKKSYYKFINFDNLNQKKCIFIADIIEKFGIDK